MSADLLLSDLARLGIRLEARGDRLRFAPRAALTPDLADRLKAHKDELLAMLGPAGSIMVASPMSASTAWQAALDELKGNPAFPADMVRALRTADVRWATTGGDRMDSTTKNCRS